VLSRCNRRNARSSTPLNGWTLGVPPFTLRTCRTARLYSTCSQTRAAHAGRRLGPWCCRGARAGSAGLRPSGPLPHGYSRERSSLFLARRGVTVRFTVAGVTSRKCGLPMQLSHVVSALSEKRSF
jgi:hypothetical protein